MARVTVENNAVNIDLATLDKAWSVQGSLRIPLAHLKLASVEDESGFQYWWRTIVGTSAPPLRMAGSFFCSGGLAFLDFSAGRNCLVLETQNERYKLVVIQTDDDPDNLSAEINRRIGRA
ncbi:MAG TPA: hypothetical protein VGR69_04790 [Candidatus Rubrimentiphilum sp.]|nr:hypothetical protein [Candidatus Rubrimentiphilum sp.]